MAKQGNDKANCVFCGGPLVSQQVTFHYEEEKRHVCVEHVPAQVCKRCGEKIYTPTVTRWLMKIVREKNKPARTIAVPVFDYDSTVSFPSNP